MTKGRVAGVIILISLLWKLGGGEAAQIAALMPIQDIQQVAAGSVHTCALTTAGGVKCWGWNSFGQLGDGSTISRSTPVDVVGLGSGITAVSAGAGHTCALTVTGGVKCWGANGAGQLGDGTTTDKNTPVDVTGLASGVAALSAGEFHTCALTTAGGVKCWGDNWAGQVGDGTTINKGTPADVTGLTSGIAALGANGAHTCALTAAGGVKCWGWNSAGQLGDGTTTNKSAPVGVVGLASGVAALSAGGAHTCALLSGGGIRCWGSNDHGQLGDGTTTNKSAPVDVVGLGSGMAALSAGGAHTCGLAVAGGVRCWGGNWAGQLGDGTTIEKATPVMAAGLGNEIAALSANGAHTCALLEAGGIKCWGDNSEGQLGNGTTANRSTPGDVLTANCYPLTRSHVGSGGDPAASPQRALTCPVGFYTAGAEVMLTAAPAAGWRVTGWSGTVNDASTATNNSLKMPQADAAVSVHYGLISANTSTPEPSIMRLPVILHQFMPTSAPTSTPTVAATPSRTPTAPPQTDDLGEPNGALGQAWGPLASGTEYRAYIYSEADKEDFYYVELPAPHAVEAWLRNIPAGNNYHLYLYNTADGLEGYSGQPGNADEHILTGVLPAGRYYVRVSQASGFSSTQMYSLRVVYRELRLSG